jgi:hypothetical protein
MVIYELYISVRKHTHDRSGRICLKMKEFDHQNKRCELGGFSRRLLKSLCLIIHRPVFIVAIDGEFEIETEKVVR